MSKVESHETTCLPHLEATSMLNALPVWSMGSESAMRRMLAGGEEAIGPSTPGGLVV